jgi:hypothetical protein
MTGLLFSRVGCDYVDKQRMKSLIGFLGMDKFFIGWIGNIEFWTCWLFQGLVF